jgi:hypothetical protein
VRSVQVVTGALKWKVVAPALEVAGEPSREHLAGCRDLGATVAVTLVS